MENIRLLFQLMGLLLSIQVVAQPNTEINFSIDEVFALAKAKYMKASSTLEIEKGFPRNAYSDGSWRQRPAEDWTSGFFPGTLWYIYEATHDWRVKDAAMKWTAALEEIQYMHHHHDIGFMMYCSFGNGYRLVNEPEYKEILLQSARTLAARFNPKTGTIRSWDWAGEPQSHPVIIDNMMNLELLLWASNHSSDPIFRNVAVAHADTTMVHHFRSNGSSYHLVLYDGIEGGVIEKRTVQGHALESSWARGQTWGMYGYTYMYQHIGKPGYLELAERTSQQFIERLPKDIVPYWDFDAPNIPNEPKDASAASIGASALLSLFAVTKKQEYYNTAVKLLNELSSDRYLNKDVEFGGLLEHNVGAKPFDSEVDVHLNYADYYYLEALLKLQDIEAAKQAKQVVLNQSIQDHQGIWYGIGKTDNEYVYKYSGGLGTYPVKHRPFLVFSEEANKTFFTYGASVDEDYTALYHAVGFFDHKTKKLSKATILLNKETQDAHDNPVIALDSSGYIWIFSTSHGNDRPSYIHKSVKPYDIEKFELVSATTEWNTIKRSFDNFSYSQVWNKANGGFMMFSTRYSFPTNRTIGFQTSETGIHWTHFQPIAAFGEGHYQISGQDKGKFFTVFNYHPVTTPTGNGINYRTNIYYLETTNNGKTWQNIEGERVELPLMNKANNALVKAYDSLEQNVYLKDVRMDENGKPILLFLTSKGGLAGPDYAPFEWHTAYWNNKAWEINKAFESDHNYDMGSLFTYPDKWQIIAPTAKAEESYAVGGEVVLWESTNKGKSWEKVRNMTKKSTVNHGYIRRAADYHPDFKAIWFDGAGRKTSKSNLYYCNEKGRVFKVE